MDPLFRWILLGLLLLGSPFALVGAWEGAKVSRELARQTRSHGKVVENRLSTVQRDGLEEQSYLPVVEFTDAQGRVTRFTDGIGSLPPDYAVGERVPIAFEPSHPTRARITSWKRLWLAPTIFVVVGLLPAAVGYGVFSRMGRASRSVT